MFPFYFLISLGYLFVAPGHKIDFWNGGFRSESGGKGLRTSGCLLSVERVMARPYQDVKRQSSRELPAE